MALLQTPASLAPSRPQPIPPRSDSVGLAAAGTRTRAVVASLQASRAVAAAPPRCRAPLSSYSSSFSFLRQYSCDNSDLSFVAGDVESECDSSAAEPVTPVSAGRSSQDFALQSDDAVNSRSFLRDALPSVRNPGPPLLATTPKRDPPPPPPSQPRSRRPKTRPSVTTLPRSFADSPQIPPVAEFRDAPAVFDNAYQPLPQAPAGPPQTPQAPQERRANRGSTSRLKRKMSSFFRRSNSALDKDRENAVFDPPSFPAAADAYHPPTGTNRVFAPRSAPAPTAPISRQNTSTAANKAWATRPSSYTPPSPSSPASKASQRALQMVSSRTTALPGDGTLPDPAEFKKDRAATGLTLRGRAVNFIGGGGPHSPPLRRHASSFDADSKTSHKQSHTAADDPDRRYPPERLPWPLPPDAGTGAKARRMSLSLPDDFNVDVAELQSEFEYQHKLLGRHGRHVGKGAASKVTLMVRKGCPGELYAVKEFRGKSHRESQADYEKKIKSEFSIAKSLHHPNIIETVRLCTDHGRWNHVMEYCSEGDLFGLVQKGHLKGDDKKKDRLCLFKQMMQGIGYLHAHGIAHRDIKLENLLLTRDSKLKITDFGVSDVFCGTHPGLRESGGQCGRNMGGDAVRLCARGICGSEPYIAPEVLAKRGAYDPRALDVWGAAIVMIYLTFGGAIWARAERGHRQYDNLADGWARWYAAHPDGGHPAGAGADAGAAPAGVAITEDDYPKCAALDLGVNPPALRRLLLQMLNPDPARRMSTDEVLTNRWLRNVECCQLESYDDLAPSIDATRKDFAGGKVGTKKIFCHNHLPIKSLASHSLGKMPGQTGY